MFTASEVKSKDLGGACKSEKRFNIKNKDKIMRKLFIAF